MISKRTYLLTFLVILFSLLASSCKGKTTPTSLPLTAGMSEIQGTVQIKEPGQSDYSLATSSTILKVNGQLLTGDDGRVRLDLSTGTIIRVAPLTVFTLLDNREVSGGLATKIKLEIGRVWVILKGGSMDVDTPSGLASVRGSYMSVEVQPDGSFILTCLEGSCHIDNDGGGFDLTNGQSAIVYNSSTPPTLTNMTEEQIKEWLNINPEATIIIPSLTPLPSATPTATDTPLPTDTPQPTPTYTPVPTNTFIPYVPPPSPTKKKPKKPQPTPTPEDGGPATFNYTDGPGILQLQQIVECYNYFYVDAVDPDGILRVRVLYSIDNPDGPWNTAFDLSWDGEGWSAYNYISADYGQTVYWYFQVIDIHHYRYNYPDISSSPPASYISGACLVATPPPPG